MSRNVKGRSGGFLLVEALISVSLLFLGLMIGLESFSLARRAVKRNDRESRLANCAAEKLMDLITPGMLGDGSCENDVQWSMEIKSASPQFEHVRLTSVWREKNNLYENNFELLRPLP